MFGLGRWFFLLFLLFLSFLGLWLGLRLRGLLLLRLLLLFCLRRLILDGFVNEIKLASNIGIDRLVTHSLVPSSDIGVFFTPLLVEKVFEAGRNEAGGEQIG